MSDSRDPCEHAAIVQTTKQGLTAMRHHFYPAMVSTVGDTRSLELPDFDIAFHIGPDADAYTLALQTAAALVEDLRKRDRVPPPPSTLASFRSRTPEPDLLFQVPVAIYRDYVRVGMNMDPVLLQRVDQLALARGMTRSAFFSHAAARELAAV